MGLSSSAFQTALKAQMRRNLKKHDAVRTAAGGLPLDQEGRLAQAAQAGELEFLLEDHVRRAHGDSLPLFVVADWLAEMKGADLHS